MMLRRLVTIAIGVLALTFAASCGGDDSQTPDAGPTATAANATATPTSGASDDDGFRAFARQIDAAVVAGDEAFFRQRMKTVRVDCSTAADANQLGGQACATPDAIYDGFTIGAWRSEGATVPADESVRAFQRLFDEQLPGEQDEYGNGDAQVYALNVRDGGYMAVITALVPRPPYFFGAGPLRAALSTSWVFEDGDWRMDSPLIIAYVLAEDFLTPAPVSGYDAWERFDPE